MNSRSNGNLLADSDAYWTQTPSHRSAWQRQMGRIVSNCTARRGIQGEPSHITTTFERSVNDITHLRLNRACDDFRHCRQIVPQRVKRLGNSPNISLVPRQMTPTVTPCRDVPRPGDDVMSNRVLPRSSCVTSWRGHITGITATS